MVKRAGPTPEERRAKAAKLDRQSLRQKHLAHRDELQSHVTEEPAITPHVLKYALDLMKLRKENPSNWESLIGKQAAMFTLALPVDSGHVKQEEFAEQQEEQFPPEPSTPLSVKKSGSCDDLEDSPAGGASWDSRSLDRRHNKLDSVGVSDLEIILYKLDPALNPYVLKSISVRGQNRQNKDRLLEVQEYISGTSPFETFNPNVFGTYGGFVVHLREKRKEIGATRARFMKWPPSWRTPGQGVYRKVKLDVAPHWGVMNQWTRKVAILAKRDLEQFDVESSFIECNFSDSRATLRMQRTAATKTTSSLRFVDTYESNIVKDSLAEDKSGGESEDNDQDTNTVKQLPLPAPGDPNNVKHDVGVERPVAALPGQGPEGELASISVKQEMEGGVEEQDELASVVKPVLVDEYSYQPPAAVA